MLGSKTECGFNEHKLWLVQYPRLLKALMIIISVLFKKNGSPTFVGKLFYQAPIFSIGDSGASIRRSRQHCTATMNECHWENDILRCWMGCGMLERGIREVIRGQGIPVNAIIKVRNSESPLIWRYCRIASVLR